MSTCNNIPRVEKAGTNQSISSTTDRNGRQVVVVTSKKRKFPPGVQVTENVPGPVAPGLQSKTGDDVKDASVFRSWAMPEEGSE